MSIDALIHRFLEDRAGLAPTELDTLVATLRADPQLAATLRDQLLLDDLLAQKLAVDRRNFEAQVGQRVADFERGQEQLHEQVADLRSMALAEQQQHLQSGRSSRWAYAVALAALLLVGFAFYLTLPHGERQPALATVVALEGEPTLQRAGEPVAAAVDLPVKAGEQIVVPRGGSMTLRYLDATEVRVKGNSAVTFGDQVPTGSKRLQIERGEVVADVQPQKLGAMQFATPHAIAKVQGAKLRLVVTDEHTLLDVSDGKVRFDRLADNRTIDVTASESGLASRDALQIRQLTWPDRRDGLTYLLSPLETCEPDNDKPLMVARNPETRNLRVTALEQRGAAALLDSRKAFELNGGYLISVDAGPDILAASHGGSEMTLEAIFSPASLDQSGPARIVALADDDNDPPNFTLTQDGSEVSFLLRTDADRPKDLPRLTVHSADSPFHLTITYRSGELVAYRDGIEIARWKDVLGSLAPWRSGPLTAGADAHGERPWRGTLEAFAVYSRCLEPSEVARNARNYRLLARREM